MQPKFYFALAACFLAAPSLFAQGHQHLHTSAEFQDPGHLTCAKNDMTEVFFTEHPEELVDAMMAREQLENFTREFQESNEQRSQTMVISVVFHIVHINGFENIDNEQVLSAIEVLNEDFNAGTPNVGSVQSAFAGVVGDVNVEFRLARKDPSGNCTNGIIRTVSNTTLDGGFNLTSVSPIWPRNRYLNIFVCQNLSGGAAGFTLLPSSVNGPNGTGIDAIYITHPYVGRIGTGNATRSHALSHEVGHWLNLEHTWGPSNNPGLASNCNGDDGVSDTPNTIGWTTCNLSGNTCSSLDNVENFMDYAYCYKMFTAGQATRMRAALMSGIAQRNQLHANSTLTLTGVNQPDEICIADFAVIGDASVCVGEEINFEDISFNGITSRSWSFPGGSPSTSGAASPVVVYNQPGSYDVTLTVSNAQGEMSVVKTGAVNVITAGQNQLPFMESFESFDDLHLENNWFVTNPDGNMQRQWELNEAVSYSGANSAYVMGRFNANGAIELLDSPTFDLSEVSNNAVLRFKYAHARRSGSSNDMLRVWITRNCGDNWSLRRTIDISELPTVSSNISGQFIPNNQNQWAEVEIDNIVSIFLNPEFRVRFEFISFAGNNIYIDDINIFDPATVSTADQRVEIGAKIYPNPSTDVTNLEYSINRPGKVSAELIDLTGKVVEVMFSADRAAGTYIYQHNIGHLSSGIYFVRLTANGESGVHKLLVK